MKKTMLRLSVAVLVAGLSVSAALGLAPAPNEGLRINNGDIGVMLWGPSNRLTFNVGKSDVWDRRYLEKAPVVTLADIKQWAKTDNRAGLWDGTAGTISSATG